LPFLVFASPPARVCVVLTPTSFFSDFQALPVLALYPTAFSPLLHTVRPCAFLTHSAAHTFEAHTIKANMITGILITIFSPCEENSQPKLGRAPFDSSITNKDALRDGSSTG